jgi:protocatechuate 3,4-dioxygenase beta subunit
VFARRSCLALLTSATLVFGLLTSSPSYAAGPTAASPTTAGPTAAGPTTAGPTAAGPTAANPTAANPTAAGPTTTGPNRTGMPSKPPRDSTPPAPVTKLKMTGNDAHSTSLSWVNPTDPDFAGVLIRRAAGSTAPIAASDGTLVAVLDSRQSTFTDKRLAAASAYSYAVFPRDKSGNAGLAAALSSATRSTSTATGLRGALTDQQGRAISRARVEVRAASSGEHMAAAITSATGQFSVTGLAPGSYLLCFQPSSGTTGHSATGYLPGCYRQQPYGYGNTGTPVTVLAGRMTSGLNDYLLSAGALSGRVTDSAGKAISAVSVIAYNPDDPYQPNYDTTTRKDGSYTLTGLSAGSYQVCFNSQAASGASTTGWLDECYDNQPPYSSPTPVPVILGRTSAGVNAALATGGAISGRVTDPSGAPLQDVLVSAFGADYRVFYTDSSGGYALTGLPSGNYTLCFDGSAATSAAAPYGHTSSCAGDHGLSVDVVTGQALTVDGTVEKAGAVGGVVTGDDGTVAGVMVTVYDSSGRQLNSHITSEDGSYQIPGLAPGEVTVCFDPAYTSGGYLRTCYGAQPDGSGSPITVTAGELSTADVQLQVGASITGTITDASGAPVSNVLVYAFRPDIFDSYSSQTDESGSFTIGGLRPADYQVCFDPSYAQGPAAGGYAAECYDDQPSFETADLVTVGAAGSVTTVDAVLGAGAAITGQVTGSDGAALGGVSAYAYAPESGQYVVASSDPQDGSYQLPGLSEGDYLVCFGAENVQQPSPTGYVNECFDNQRESYTATPVHVTAGAVTSGIDAELAVGAAISGRVTDPAGNGLPNAYVETFSVGSGYSFGSIGVTDDTGRYRLNGLPAEAVLVCFATGEIVTANGAGYVSECYDDQPDLSTANPVTTTAGQVQTGIDAVLAAGAAISGQLTDSAGNAIPNAYAFGYSADGSYLGQAFTDETGRYRLASLPATAVLMCFQGYEGGADGTGYAFECYDDQPDLSTANPVTTTAGQVRTGIDAELADAPPNG